MRNSVNRQSYELLYDHLEEINIFSQEVHIRTTDRSWVQVSELEYEKLILDDRVYFGDLNNLRIIIRMDTLLNDGYGKVKDGFEHSYTNVMNLLDKKLCLTKHSRKRVLPDSRLDLISMFPIQKQGAYTHYKFNELGELRCMTTNRFNSSMNKLLRLYKGPSNNKHFRYLLYCMVKYGSNVNLIRSSIRLSKLYFCIDGRNAYTKWKSVVLNVVFSFYRRFID